MKLKKEKNGLIKVGDLIVKFRYLFLGLFVILGVFSLFHLNDVEINYEITSYLSDETETKQGLEIMEDEFGELNSLQLMITDISFEEANQIYQDLSKIENIKNISFGDTENYYHDDKALYIINVDSLNDEETQNLKENIIEVVDSQEYYLYDAFSEDVVGGMNLILALAVIVIVLVLLLTSKSYFDIVLAFIIFGLSILINMGTNFIFGEISYITESIAGFSC